MTEQIWNCLQVRYVKLHFHLRMLEDTQLPRNKVSTLRGGMGEMLLRANCVQDRNCDSCGFLSECVVRRMMYSKFEIQPAFMHQGDSAGYVIECEDYEEEFLAGESLEFQLLLFGKNIVYFNQYMQAFAYLGMEGIGKHKSHFVVEAVTNTNRKTLLEGSNIYKKNYEVRTIAEYVRYRMSAHQHENAIQFHTPLSIKHKGKKIETFDMEAIMAAASRRLYILDCFEGMDTGKIDITGHVPRLIRQNVRKTSVRRYSSTHDEKIYLNGIRGSVWVEEPDETARILLYAGELMHIGKNTSFGFGRYSLVLKSKIQKEETNEIPNDT